MSSLPLAELTMRHALRVGDQLILHVQGFTAGFGGSLVVELDSKIYPPDFVVRASPGNGGITGQAPDRVPTEDAYSFSFPRNVDMVHLRDAAGIHDLSIVEVRSSSETSEGRWSAVQDFRNRPPRLTVNGEVMMPNPGYHLFLTRAEPQGINEQILLLDLNEEPPTGLVSDVMTLTRVDEYVEEVDHEFTSVEINPGGIMIPVETTH